MVATDSGEFNMFDASTVTGFRKSFLKENRTLSNFIEQNRMGGARWTRVESPESRAKRMLYNILRRNGLNED